MTVVRELLDKTKKLKAYLTEGLPENDRDAYLEKLQTLLAERQHLFTQLTGSYTKEEKQLGAQIVSLNAEIAALLKDQSSQLKRELDQFQRKKQRSAHYANPYANVSIDGMFFDKKK